MKNLLSAILIFGLVNAAQASTFSETQIRVADLDNITSPNGDAPGHRLYHMLRKDDGLHWEMPTMSTNTWVYFDADYNTSKLVDRVGFNFRYESKHNKIRLAYVYAYNNGVLVASKLMYFNVSYTCPEIAPKANDEGPATACSAGGVSGDDASVFFDRGIRANKFRFWFIGDIGVPFTPQIDSVHLYRSASTR